MERVLLLTSGRIQEFQNEFTRLDSEDVYNCDETGLFLKAMANEALAVEPAHGHFSPRLGAWLLLTTRVVLRKTIWTLIISSQSLWTLNSLYEREIPVELRSRTIVKAIPQEAFSSPITDPNHESEEDTMESDQGNVNNYFQETLEEFLDAIEDLDNIVHGPELTTLFNDTVVSIEMFVKYRRLMSE
ncbi:hypothetical protein BCR41DRAFT_402355 [Lobosporangium transversale]|uniref:DDE-1 domain-containing protein n=1 Tax=Lobosporangium transversale TaxID=64571 RepID=A0A1Y2G9G0_9FUNG|nr:hypothetical protein BCR41DRAFT_402355 [Lobosporangium transversale]ORY95138.1 hypothetical protein BCR41DRAFT_402355 [Lobosporangium transversale]|eukprot:XP_021875345.1 hypothetical protein BCR41DRAFT_402355 [Lobosporangium transversale]